MSQRQPLAIVGYAYRAPGVGRKGLFEFLEQGKSAWSKVPADRFNHEAYYHPDNRKPGFISSQGGHFLPDDLYAFDPAFFNIKADEARSMDPQHRLLLECAFEAAENAGITLTELLGANIGVFAASDKSEYYNSEAQDLHTSSIFTATGVNPCMFSNRLSYFFGLTGPSVSVDAACASSSYAVHLACQSLLAGECSAAFVGGAKTINGPNQWIELDTMGTLSPEGKCFSYDSRASGFGRGEGASCIVIKPLSDALACGDPVRAVIRNSAGNHSGRTQGISMPGRQAQEALLSRLHHEVDLDPNETTYAEGHGTGTPVGDPIEASAIASVIASRRSPSNPLYIGSVKSNLGHIENASGLISLIKCIMMLENSIMLPSVGFAEFNPGIEGSERLKILAESVPWPQGAAKRVCMSNFGFGGSNAALLLEAAPKDLSPGKVMRASHRNGVANGYTNGYANGNGNGNGHDVEDAPQHLFVFSARSPVSLEAYVSSFQNYLQSAPYSSQHAKNLAFTLGQRRTHFPYRLAVTADSTDSLRQRLEATSVSAKSGTARDPILAFVFTGQGSQHYQMARGLQGYSTFEQSIIAAEKVLLKLGATWYLTDELAKDQHESRVDDPEISQPACTAVQLALVALLQSWDIRPRFVLGHSSGEVAAAFAAGIISLEAAMAIAYFKGLAASRVLIDPTVQGAMLAVGASPEEAEKLLPPEDEGYAIVAAHNSPTSVTISGDVSAIDLIQEQAEEQGLFVRRLKVGVAYHSQHMKRVSGSFLASIKQFWSDGAASCSDGPGIPPTFISTVTGRVECADTVSAQHWVDNLIQPVEYQAAVETLFHGSKDIAKPNILVEVGPHSALQSSTKQILDRLAAPSGGQDSRSQVASLASLLRGKDATTNLLDLAGKLFVMGLNLNFNAINQNIHSRVQVLHDLPPYEWNKATRYVHRPRVGTNKLFGGTSYNKLLGWQSPYSEGAEQVFRNVFTLDDLPWIRDHAVSGDILFPFTGFVSLAIEAFRSLNTTAGRTVVLREFHVSASLKIEEDQAVDVTTKFRPAQTGTKTTSTTTWAFEILSWSEAHGWTRHSNGLAEFDPSEEPFSESLAVQAALKTLSNQTLQHRSAQHEYELLRDSNGVSYGPAFRTAVDFWQGPGVAVHTMTVRQIESNTLEPRQESMVTVDPPTLDTVLHSFGIFQARNGPRPILVPSFCLQWRISNDIAVGAGQQLSIVSRRLSYDEKSANTEMDFVVFDISGTHPEPVAEIGPLKFQCIARPDENDLRLPHTFFFQNVPYLNLMDRDVLTKMIEADCRDDDAVGGEIAHRYDLDQAALYYMSLAMQQEHDVSGAAPHMADFVNWAKGTLSKHSLPAMPDAKAFIEDVSASNATGELVCAVGRQLPEILCGQKQGLEVMLENDLLWRTYAENVAGIRANAALAGYMERLLQCNPELRILELGAGTASATVPVLEAIDRGTGGMAPQFAYTFTDISAGFFDKAKERLSQWSDRMIYSKLDISQDPLSQGFTPEAYDVVLASNVLHATSDIIATLKNVGCLLKPGGKLALMEVVKEPPPSFIPYALLSGWWVFEDGYRSDGPGLTKASWDAALKASGFSGLEGSVDDYPDRPEQLFSALWSSRNSQEAAPKTADSITMYHCSDEEGCASFGNILSASLSIQLGGKSTTKHLSQAGEIGSEATSIVLDGQHRSIFSNMSPGLYYKMKDVFLHSSSVLWVLPEKAHPDASMIRGLLRTLRLELPSAKLFLLEAPLDGHGATAVAQLVQHMMRDPNSIIRLEQEYVLVNHILHVPRLRLVEAAQEIFAMEAGVPIKSEQKVWQEHRTLEMTIDAVGSPDSIYFKQGHAHEPASLGDDEIIVEVEAAGVNFIDLLLVLGSLPWSPPGLEGAGVVTHRGSRVSDLQVGDHVFYAVDKAGMATSVTMPSKCACKIPAGLDAVSAASMPIAYSTAILSLVEVGRLQKGDSVLIHSASGAAGQACVQIAQDIGSQVFVTAGTPEKREFLAQTYGIPQSRIFSSRTSEFKQGILQATGNRGVDVVVNCLSGHLLQQTWDLIAENGRFLEIGKKDFLENSYLPMRHFVRNVSFNGIDLRRVIATKPASVRGYLSTITRMVQNGRITPIRPISSIPVSQAKSGLRKLQAGNNIGKVIVTFGRNESVMAERPSPLRTALQTSTLLQPDATYVIAGGTGGIGRALVPWMISKGAKNVIMLGRSALSNARVKALLKNYEGTGICVRAIPCDVGSRDDVVRASEALRDLPRVRGVVHSAICLRDSIFANLEYDDWQLTAKSRIQGAWNLHELFSSLDFFVALSGMTGMVGNGGQSVYTGTSTFLEAFTDHRIQLGLPAAVIHLPPVSDFGLVAELSLIQPLKRSIGGLLRGAEVLTLIEGSIIGPQSGLGVNGNHLAWSLVSASEVETLPWEHFYSLSVMRRLRSGPRGTNFAHSGAGTSQGQLKIGSPELIMDALSDKVSAMTAIDRSEITPTKSLAEYGLDSLISLELRNWIRRNFELDLDVDEINASKDLKSILDRVLSAVKAE